MNKKYILIVFGLIIAGFFAYRWYAISRIIGPDLLSVKETKELAKEEGGLVTIERVDFSTAGPVYRLVVGFDNDEREKAVWIGTKIVHSVYLDRGIAEKDLIERINEEGYSDVEINLVYVSGSNLRRGLTEGVFWTAEYNNKNHYIDFEDGKTVIEFKKWN